MKDSATTHESEDTRITYRMGLGSAVVFLVFMLTIYLLGLNTYRYHELGLTPLGQAINEATTEVALPVESEMRQTASEAPLEEAGD